MGAGASTGCQNQEYINQRLQAIIKTINNDLVLYNNNKKYIKIIYINNTFRFIINQEMNSVPTDIIVHLVTVLNGYAKNKYLLIKNENSIPLINIEAIEQKIMRSN